MLIDLSSVLRRAGVSVEGPSAVVVVVVPQATSGGAEREPRRWRADPALAARALEFVDDLIAGRIATQAVALPARSDDLFRWYELWCERSGLLALAQNRFVHALKQGGRVAVRSMRIRSQDGVKQVAVAFPTTRPPALGGALASVAAFRSALDRYADGEGARQCAG